MRELFHRIFCLYAGEGKNAILFAALGFIWALAAYCGLTLADGLFLERVGAESLPYSYLFTACSLFAVSSIFLYLHSRFTPFRIYLIVLFLIGLTYLLFATLLIPGQGVEPSKMVWFSFKIFCNVSFIVLTTCFWFFLDQYYNLQNAKRLYGIFNASIFLGNAVGAAFLSFSINSLQIRSILLSIIAIFIIALAFIIYIRRQIKPLQDEEGEESLILEKTPFKTVIKNVLSSRYTLLLITTYLVMQTLNIVTEYNYMEGMALHFKTLEHQTILLDNQLTAFLSECMAWIALANMVFGLFFYSRFINRWGVNNVILISPIFFLATLSGWTFSSALFFSILGLVAVEGIAYLFDENNSHLLLNAVPSELKSKIRIAIDSFFEPLGMLFCSLIFLFFKFNHVFLGLILAAITLGIAIPLRMQYKQAILNNLSKMAIHFQRSTKQWLDLMNKKQLRETEVQLMARLRRSDSLSELMSFDLLLQLNDTRLLPRLLNHLSSMSIRQKIKAIDLISHSSFALDTQVLERLHFLMHESTHPLLKGAIHFYFAKYGLFSFEKILSDFKSEDLTLQGAAILALKRRASLADLTLTSPKKGISIAKGWHEWAQSLYKSWSTQKQDAISSLHLQATKLLQQWLSSDKESYIAMALQILKYEVDSKNIDIVLPFLNHPSLFICRQAALTLEHLIDSSDHRHGYYLLDLLPQQTDTAIRQSLIKAILQIKDSSLLRPLILSCVHFRPVEKRLLEEQICKVGLRSIPLLLAMTKDSLLQDRCRVLAGSILGKLSLAQLQANLYEIISSEIDRAYLYFYHSFDVQKRWQEFPMLKDALTSGFHSAIDFVIQLLGVAGSIEKSDILSHALRSKNPKIKGNAIETLEKTCGAKIFRRLKPLIDDRPIEDKLRLYLKQNRPVLDFEQLLDVLDRSASPLEHIIALTLKAKHDVPGWRSSLRKHMEKDEEVFHYFALELLGI